MSLRELKALDTDLCLQSRTRSGEREGELMESTSRQVEEMPSPRPVLSVTSTPKSVSNQQLERQLREFQNQLERCHVQLQEKDQELQRLVSMVELSRAEAMEALEIANAQSTRVTALQRELESVKLECEVEKYRALEELRREHKEALAREISIQDREQQRMDAWMEDLRRSHQMELEHLQRLQRGSSQSSDHDAASPEASCPLPDELGGDEEADGMLPTISISPDRISAASTVAGNTTSSLNPSAPVFQFGVTPITANPFACNVPTVMTPGVASHVVTPAAGAVSGPGGRAGVSVGAEVAAPTPKSSVITGVPAFTPMIAPLSVGARVSAPMTVPLSAGARVSAPMTVPGASAPVAPLFGGHAPIAWMEPPCCRSAGVPGVVAGSTAATGTVHDPVGMSGVVGATIPVSHSVSVAGAVSGSREVTVSDVVGTTRDSGTGVMKSVTDFLKVQADILAAQAKAVAVQNLPALPCFTGEGGDVVDDGFEKWVERFKERAAFAKWSSEEQLYQLKLHLDRTAMEVFRMLPPTERATIDEAIRALKKRFKPSDIEELRGLEFHRLTQADRTIEQLGISIQQLGRRAFPTIAGKDFDRLLKGRFYQALLVKWQRKLGPPKSEESFHDLFARARMLEEHERQYAQSAQTRSSVTRSDDSRKSVSSGVKEKSAPTFPVNKGQPPRKSTSEFVPVSERQCYHCRTRGHLRQDCPKLRESMGRQNSNTNAVEAQLPFADLDELTEAELEQMLAEKRLDKEKRSLPSSEINSVVAAVGDLVYIDIDIEGITIPALVDTGAQSTIISRSTLHQIYRHLKEEGRELPEMRVPSVRLYGKDGEKGGVQLKVTAELPLTFTLDKVSVSVPVFVQPESEQPCLMGMNIIPLLGIDMVRSTGKPLVSPEPSSAPPPSDPATDVSLIKPATLPSQKGRVLKVKVTSPDLRSKDMLLFEPDSELLSSLGVSADRSVVSADEHGDVWIPIENYQGVTAHLEAGVHVGTVRATEVVSECVDNDPLPCLGYAARNGSVGAVKAIECTPKRLDQLMEELGLPDNRLSSQENSDLKDLIAEFADVFALDDSELGCTDVVKHSINTGDHPPIKQQPYRTPLVRRAKMAAMIKQMEEQGIVKPSSSPWASPVVLVNKKDGDLRFCIDYRRLNAVTKKDVYPLPRIEDILDALGGAQYFSTLDLASGYWQVELDEDAQAKSAFTTYNGLYEFTRMPFGLCNAPATFQRVMQRILTGMECYVYIDDLLAASKTFSEHLKCLKEVLLRLRQASLRLKPRKCRLLRSKVHYLGFVVSSSGIQPDSEKTEKVREYPRPTDVTSVRQFLGLASYYRRFVANFATIAAPLHVLTKKNTVFQWTPQCEEAYERLKEALTTTPVLAYPQVGPGCSFILETDASTVGLGAVLSQAQDDGSVHPIAYASRAVDKHEKNYSVSELETLGLVWAVRYFRHYLLGHPCTVFTDHVACLSILNTKKPSGKLARWALTIQEMDLTIKHRSGKSNKNADVLSRLPALSCNAESAVNVVQTTEREADVQQGELCQEQAKDPELVMLISYVKEGIVPEDLKLAKRLTLEGTQYSMVNGLLKHENPNQPGEWRVVVPTTLRQKVLKEMHSGRFSGHYTWKKTYLTMRKRYWWKGMCGDVEKFCRSCLECVTRKGAGRCIHPPLATIPIGGPFHRMGVDVLQLPLTESGNRYVVVFMDYFTKWVEAFAVPDQTAETIARLLVEEIFCRHGAPEHLMSDRGANFLSDLVMEICEQLRIKKVNTSGYHPQTNGLVEKFNSTLIGMISKVAESSGRDWDQHLPFLLFAYRVAVHESTQESPFFLLYGRDARIPSESVLEQKASPYQVDIDDYRRDLTDSLTTAWALAKENIEGAQRHQKKMYDRNVKNHTIEPGDRVMIYMPSAVAGKSWKLARPYHGPYRVLNVTPTNLEARLVEDLDAEPIFVAIDRVRLCSSNLPDTAWTGPKRKRRQRKRKTKEPQPPAEPSMPQGPITRSRSQLKQ